MQYTLPPQVAGAPPQHGGHESAQAQYAQYGSSQYYPHDASQYAEASVYDLSASAEQYMAAQMAFAANGLPQYAAANGFPLSNGQQVAQATTNGQ